MPFWVTLQKINMLRNGMRIAVSVGIESLEYICSG